MSKKDEGRPSKMAKDYYHCSNCMNYGLESVCDMCVTKIEYDDGERFEHTPTMFVDISSTYEYVDHPSHYGGENNPYECIKVIEAWGLDKNFDLGTAIRYICRAGEKPDNPTLQDLKKARWYLDREIQKLEKQND